ncbi:MAG: M23 family metallopeptidase [Patescibacteria group bacterium]
MSFRNSAVKYSYPVIVANGVRISYDESPAHVGPLKHSVDFIVPVGTPVFAAADGVVVDLKSDSDKGGEASTFEPFGNFVELEHESGEYSEYEHLQKDGVAVALREKVRRGQIVGYSGATGYLAHLGPHLHFMVGRYDRSAGDYETIKIAWAI